MAESSNSIATSSRFSSFNSSSSFSTGSNRRVLSIECLKGGSKSEEWTDDMLQTGDIVEEIIIGNTAVRSPFKNGNSGVQKFLRDCYKSFHTSIRVRVRRGDDESVELQACIVPKETAGKKHEFMLRSIDDPNYAVGFVDRTEADCLALLASRNSRMVKALAVTPLQEGHVPYPWEKIMQELLSIPSSSIFLSMLFLPRSSDRNPSRYNDLEDTLNRANAWLAASKASGVPVVFMNIQTESLLTKISGETASSTVNASTLTDLSNLANASLYGFEDYHGVDIGVVRAVRLWYSPIDGEMPFEIIIKESDKKLGFAISRTEEGFIYILSVSEGNDNTPSMRSGLSYLYNEARKANKLLVISRVSNQKVLPWIVSSTGAIRCFDTVSLSQKFLLHRHTKVPIKIHMFLWDQTTNNPINEVKTKAPVVSYLSLELQTVHLIANDDVHEDSNESTQSSNISNEGSEAGYSRNTSTSEAALNRDTAAESSFRFHNFKVPHNWL